MPEKFIERPPTIDAVQFAGGQECADQINNWLSSYGGMVTYDAPRDRVIVQSSDGAFLTATNSDWVLMDSQQKLSIMKNVDFASKYVSAPGSE